jgi:glyoxylase-like metal-dependent hydrolase (beta-lactamase superfamily II)
MPDAAPAVVRLEVGTGSPEGANSAYLLPEHATVVDPGPPSDAAFERLTTGIADAGYDLAAVEHVVVSHWHVDHIGLAPRLAAAADATVHMHERDAPLLAEYTAARRRRVARDAETLAAWGVPADRVAAVRAGDTPSGLPDTTPVVAHADGDTVAGGDLLHTPGHTEGHLAVQFGDALFVGDAVLPTYTPNVGGSDTRASDPLREYLRTLAAIRRHDGPCYPGHGRSLAMPDRIETIRDHHRERARRVIERLDARGTATPWDVAVDLFGDLSGVHVKFGAGEASAHLRALAGDRYVEQIDTRPARYRLVETPAPDAPVLPNLE